MRPGDRRFITEGYSHADWFVCEPDRLCFTVARLPVVTEVGLPVDITNVIELMTR